MLKLDFDSIISSSTSSNLQATGNNIDRSTTNTNTFLSLSNLRRITVGFGPFASNNTSNNLSEGDSSTTHEII